MMVGVRIGDAEPHGDDIEKRRFGLGTADVAKIAADMEADFIDAGGQGRSLKQRPVEPAIGIGDGGRAWR